MCYLPQGVKGAILTVGRCCWTHRTFYFCIQGFPIVYFWLAPPIVNEKCIDFFLAGGSGRWHQLLIDRGHWRSCHPSYMIRSALSINRFCLAYLLCINRVFFWGNFVHIVQASYKMHHFVCRMTSHRGNSIICTDANKRMAGAGFAGKQIHNQGGLCKKWRLYGARLVD